MGKKSTPGKRLRVRFGLMTLGSSTINILVIAPFLVRLLDWDAAQWGVFWYIVSAWIVLLAAAAQLMQRAVRVLARFLDRWRRGLVRPPSWVLHGCLACLALVGVATGAGLAVAGGLVGRRRRPPGGGAVVGR